MAVNDDESTSHGDTDTVWDALDELVLRVVDSPPDVREAVLGRLCEEHPDAAAMLERRVRIAVRAGLVAAAEPEPSPEPTPARIGDFRLIERLGSGAMGVVYLAEQQSLGRRVALKVIRGDLAVDERARERFRREASAISRLDHPAVCPLFEVGQTEGVPYIAMRYLKGETLAARLNRERDARAGSSDPSDPSTTSTSRSARVEAMVEMVETLARGVGSAHRHGVIHRDIKPGNIILTRDGPVIVDFGLAKILGDDAASLTQSKSVVGTPAYLAPELLDDAPERADARSDVYGLGVTLYEGLTLQLPFEPHSRERLYRAILSGDVRDPRRLERRIPSDLAVVLSTAMARDPRRRYQTADEFAEDLRRVRLHQPIRARRTGTLLRMRHWTRRHPAIASALVAMGVGLMATTWALLRAHEVTARLRQRQYAFDVREAQGAIEAGRRADGVAMLEALAPEHRGWEWRRLAWVADRSEHRIASPSKLRGAALAADGSRMATGDADGVVSVFDTATGREIASRRTSGTAAVVAVGFEASGAILAVDADGACARWDPDRGASFERTSRIEGAFSTVTLSPDCRRAAILVATGPQRLSIVDLASAATLAIDTGETVVKAAAWSPDGALIALGGTGLRVFDAATGDLRHRTPDEVRDVSAVAFAPDGRTLAYAEHTSYRQAITELELTDTGAWRARRTLKVEDVVRLAYSPDAHRLAATTARVAVVWSAAISPELTIRGCDASASLAFSPDGRQLICVGADGLGVWNLGMGPESQVRLHRGIRHGVLALSRDSARMVTDDYDNRGLTLWAVDTGELLATFRRHDTPVRCAAFAPDGERIVSGAEDGAVFVWRRDGTVLHECRGHAGAVLGIAVSPDGARIASGGVDGTLRLWDLASGRDIAVCRGHAERVNCLAFTPGGNQVVSGSGDATLAIWDATTGALIRSLPSGEPVTCLAIDPTGAVIFAGGASRLTKWDAQSGQLTGQTQVFCADLAVSPDGRRVAIAGHANGLEIHDAANGETVWRLGGKVRVEEVEFSTDGRVLVYTQAGGAGGVVVLHTTPPIGGFERRALVRQAHERTRELFQQCCSSLEVVRGLRSDAAVDAPTLDLAATLATRWGDGPYGLLEDSWRIVVTSTDPSEYRRAVAMSERARELEPTLAYAWSVLGCAQHLAGRHEAAVQTLAEADRLNRPAPTYARARDLVFASLALHAIGDQARATEMLTELRANRGAILRGETGSGASLTMRQLQPFFDEAERRIDG